MKSQAIMQQHIHTVEAIAERLAPSAPFVQLARQQGDSPLARRNEDQGAARAFFDFVQRLQRDGYAPLLSASIVDKGSLGTVAYRVSDDANGSFVELTIDVVKDGLEFYTASIVLGRQNSSTVMHARGDNDSRLTRNLYGKFFSAERNS